MHKILLLLALVVTLFACEQEERVFEKSADERAAEAIDSLKNKLVSAPNGWIVNYRPVQESGSFNMLLTFDEENKVNIRTDYGENDGEFYNQTITYRIDNSLGIELIFESYSFFSFLFEQNRATYGGEFEFNYINEVDGALIFNSKSDVTSPTTLILQPAGENSEGMLGMQLAQNLNILSDNLPTATSVYKLSYSDKDLVFYLSFDDFQRIINFSYVAPKNGIENGQSLNFSTPYTIQGDSMVFDNPLKGNFLGSTVAVSGIRFTTLTEGTFDLCGQQKAVKQYTVSLGGVRASMESTLFDPVAGADFGSRYSFYYSPVQGNFATINGASVAEEIRQNVPGALSMQLYYYDTEDPFMYLGFYLSNENGTATYALKEFTPAIVGNKITFEFAPDYTLFGDTTATVNETAMDVYLDALTEGDNTYILKLSDQQYEFFNPCSGLSLVFIGAN